MAKKKKIKIILEKSSLGYYAFSNEFSRIKVTGNSVTEIKEHVAKIIEARLLQLEEQGKDSQAEVIRNSEVKYLFQV